MSMLPNGPPGDRLLRLDEIAELVGLADTATKALVRSPDFPTAVRINRRVVRCWRSEVLAWLERRRSRHTAPPLAPLAGVGRRRRHH